MKKVNSLCASSIRKYYKADGSPIQVSLPGDGKRKIQIQLKGNGAARTEDNYARAVFELSDKQVADLVAILRGEDDLDSEKEEAIGIIRDKLGHIMDDLKDVVDAVEGL